MEQKIKEIISIYIKIPVDQIGMQTLINRSVISSSILLHRMYAHLANEGIVIQNYQSVNSFAELLSRSNIGGDPQLVPVDNTNSFGGDFNNQNFSENSIGIDIEKINQMPVVTDYRADEFYKMNFSSSEIAYCILRPEPLVSFAGLFAAKEAIVKANNQFKNISFNQINIDHLPDGKPVHNQFNISISHSNEMAIAVAVSVKTDVANFNSQQSANSFSLSSPNYLVVTIISVSALIIALLTLIIVVFY